MRLQMMAVCDKIREADEIGDQRGVRFSFPLISKAGWFYTLIPSIFCPGMFISIGNYGNTFPVGWGFIPCRISAAHKVPPYESRWIEL